MSNETINNLLNFNQVFAEKLEDIKRAFISFYGVENAEFINKRFSNIIPVGYLKPSNLSSMLYNVKDNINNDLIKNFFAQTGIEDNDKNRRIFMSSDISNKYSTPFGKYSMFLSIKEDEPGYNSVKGYASSFTTAYLGKTVDYLTEEEKNHLKNLNDIYEKLIIEYSQRFEPYKPFKEYVDSCEKIERQIHKKYLIKYIEEFKYLLTDEEKVKFENYKNNDHEMYLNISSPYFSNINVTAKVEYFKDSDQAALDKKDSSTMSIIVRAEQIKFFQAIGINLGNDCTQYKNNPECQKMMPKLNELANKMSKRRAELVKECDKEYYASLPEYQANASMLNSKEFYSQDQLLSSDYYIENATCIIPNVINNNGQVIISPILAFASGFIGNYTDARIIHELNHAYELTLKDINSQHIDFECGWDFVRCNVEEKESVNETKREYELFNEIINELIAQEITTSMHNQGKYIFNNVTDAKIKGATSYEHTLFLVQDFYDIFKEEILESRMEGKIGIILDTVGKENFNALNKLFEVFNENFNGNNYYRLMNYLKGNADTPETRLFHELVNKKNEIINNMIQHRQQKDERFVA